MESLVITIGAFFLAFDILLLILGLLELKKMKTSGIDLDTYGPLPIGWTNWNAKRVATLAIIIALSVVMSFIAIPSPSGTVCLDLMPGYFMALYAGPINGLIAIFFGHLLVAIRTGFSLTVPVHLTIGIACAGCGSVLWLITKKTNNRTWGFILAIVVAILGNALGSNIFASWLFLGTAMAIGSIPPMFVGSTANVLVGALIWRAVKGFTGSRRS
jgi:uncharacterized membrane protein